MGDKTKIEWTNFFGPNSGATWNPLAAFYEGKRGWACIKVDDACRECYAELLNKNRRFDMGTGLPYDVASMKKVEIKLVNLDQPLRWNKPRGIFVGSMTDLFGTFITEQQRRAVFSVMALGRQHIFITLTKRFREMVNFYINPASPAYTIPDEEWSPVLMKTVSKLKGVPKFPAPNVIVGITVGHQKIADDALPYMRRLRNAWPDMKIMISNEPAIGKVDWSGWEGVISWMVTGGESGEKARPCDPYWVQSTRNWCIANNVPFFFKQWGSWLPEDGAHIKVGKKAAGHLLDGQVWQQFPMMGE